MRFQYLLDSYESVAVVSVCMSTTVHNFYDTFKSIGAFFFIQERDSKVLEK